MDRNSTPASSPPTGQKRAAAGSARSATPQQPIRTFRYNYYVNPAAEADSAAEEEANESKSRRRNLKKRARASQLKAGGLTSYRSALSRGEGPRRMARFDWTLGAFPRPLSAFSRSSTWALLHCLWYEHHIARDAELEAISGARSPWRSCWSDEGFARAWEELREGVDERVKGKMRLPVGGDGRGGLLMRKNLEWGVKRGLFAPPHENRYQGDNFNWLAAVFEKYQDFCAGKQLLWGGELVPRTPLSKIQDLLDARNKVFRSMVTRVWSDSPHNWQNSAARMAEPNNRTESKMLAVAFAILVGGLRRFYMGHADHKCPGCKCCCMFDCCYAPEINYDDHHVG